MENARVTGTVQWFSRVKGYGFIRPDGQEEDVFVHYSSIVGEGYRNLRLGQRVEFVMEDSEKGPQAGEVTELEGEGDVTESMLVAEVNDQEVSVELTETEEDEVTEAAP